MSRKIVQVEEKSNEFAMDAVKKVLGERCACFVLITCSAPSKDGKMQVEMNYDGDEGLAAFLVENASQVFDERMNCRESKHTAPG
jgi:hypothetical protein